MIDKWDLRYWEMAKLISTWSKDPSTKCGAVIYKDKKLISIGYNGFPANVLDDDELYNNRDTKLLRVIHAELNAIFKAKSDRDLENSTICVFPMPPCNACMAAIIQCRIARVVTKRPTEEQYVRWFASFNAGIAMAVESGLKIEYIEE